MSPDSERRTDTPGLPLRPLTLGAFGAEGGSGGHTANELGLPSEPALLSCVTLGNGLPLSEPCSSSNVGTKA